MNKIEAPIITKVGKVGGSSLANGERFKIVAKNIARDPGWRYTVVSAPGKENPLDKKITETLIKIADLNERGETYDKEYNIIYDRFEKIGKGLNCRNKIVEELNVINEGVQNGKERAWIESAGERVSALALSEYIKAPLVLAEDIIIFKKDGGLNKLSYKKIKKRLESEERAVIPGFYGLGYDKKIKTFPRGGSDITGAIIARGVDADLYENWTDVNGLLAADPKIAKDPKTIDKVTGKEITELAYRGADVLHSDTVREAGGIPINIRNTFNPAHPGTMIVEKRISPPHEKVISVAGKDGFTAIEIEKNGMNEEVGTGSKAFKILWKEKMPFEHSPSSIDSLTLIVPQKYLDGKEVRIVELIQKAINPDNITVEKNLGLLSVVGQEIKNNIFEISGKFSLALNEQNINGRIIIYPPSGISIIYGVDGHEIKKATKIAYETLIKKPSDQPTTRTR